MGREILNRSNSYKTMNAQPSSTAETSLTEHMGQAEPFRAVAYHDVNMDCIRILFRDCSIIEHRVHPRLTILTASRPVNGVDGPDVVGLVIKGVGHLCDELDLPKDAVIHIASLLDKFVKTYEFDQPVREQVIRVRTGASLADLRIRMLPDPALAA